MAWALVAACSSADNSSPETGATSSGIATIVSERPTPTPASQTPTTVPTVPPATGELRMPGDNPALLDPARASNFTIGDYVASTSAASPGSTLI